MIKKLILFLCDWCEKRGKVVMIMDRAEDGSTKPDLYLKRYMLFFSRFGCIYIHRFFRSDDETHHDHPWNFFTWVIEGGYQEETIQSDIYGKYGVWPAEFTKKLTTRKPGTIAYRRAKDIHRVILPRNFKAEEEHLAPLTVCFIGPRIREWGFWTPSKDRNKKEWTIWTKFLDIDPSSPDFGGHS